jgi:hypothetical protein
MDKSRLWLLLSAVITTAVYRGIFSKPLFFVDELMHQLAPKDGKGGLEARLSRLSDETLKRETPPAAVSLELGKTLADC